jgi:predicted ArsR family transcriptional regulator
MQHQQHDLFIEPKPPRTLARRRDPATSQEAAARVAEFAGTHHAKILEALIKIGSPAGAEQIAAYSKIDAYQVRKRLPELDRAGLVRSFEQTRVTASGRHERLWGLK